MSAVLQVADQQLGAEDICALLTSPHVLPHLLRELIVEQITATVECSTEELEAAFREKSQLPQFRNLPPAHIERFLPRQLKLEKFKEENWGDIVEAEFAQHQTHYDQVLFSLIQTDNLEIIQELYFRLREGEANFGELATQYSKGPEARTNGLVGPLELYNLHPKLSNMLRISQPGQVSPPFRVDQWVVIVRLERYLPAQFDQKLRQRLIDEKFESWMQQAIAQHIDSVRLPDELQALPTLDLQEHDDLSQAQKNQRSPGQRRITQPLQPQLAPSRSVSSATPETETFQTEDPKTEDPKTEGLSVEAPAPPSSSAQFPPTKVREPVLLEDAVLDEIERTAPAQPAPPPQPDSSKPTNEAIAFNPRSLGLTRLNTRDVPPWRRLLVLALFPLLLAGGVLAARLNWSSLPTIMARSKVESSSEAKTNTGEQQGRDRATNRTTRASQTNTRDADAELRSRPNVLPDDVKTPFHNAVNHANQAVALIPAATNATDWDRIAQEWEQAITMMAMVPEEHPRHSLAQSKVKEYQGYLNYARQQAQNPDYAFQQAVRHGEKAANSSQAAKATQDWDTVIAGWDAAIAAMQAVPVESEHYAVAQRKVLEYQGYRKTIQAIASARAVVSVVR